MSGEFSLDLRNILGPETFRVRAAGSKGRNRGMRPRVRLLRCCRRVMLAASSSNDGLATLIREEKK
jgi:hypothetical protein